MKFRSTRHWMAPAACVAMVLAGCGSDSKSAATTPAPATPSTAGSTAGSTAESTAESTAGTTAESAPGTISDNLDPIKIMVTGTFSSPAISYPQIPEGAQLAVDAVNASGGIKGHKVELDQCNDGGDANTAAECIAQAVSDHVVSIIGSSNQFTAAAWPVLEKANIPWVGTSVISEDQLTDPMSFPLDGGTPAQFAAMTEYLVKHGSTNIAVTYADVSQGQYMRRYFSSGIEAAGGKEVAAVPITVGAPDYTSVAAQVADAHPDAVVCACAPSDTAKLIVSLRQAGVNGPFGAAGGSFIVDDLTAIGDSAGTLIGNSGMLGATDDDPGLAQLKAEFANSNSDRKDELFVRSWLSIHVIADALNVASTLDSNGLVDVLNTKTDLPTYGVVRKISWSGTPTSVGPRIFSVDMFFSTWKDGAFVPTT